ncbi:MAG: DUF3124 domain-containing protein [Alphaproteobacteria bacterium]|nr:DUF3124 domain-containing protein [Alphaproteobacteria bacterium]
MEAARVRIPLLAIFLFVSSFLGAAAQSPPAHLRSAPATGATALELFADSIAEPPAGFVPARRGALYAPAYSSLFSGAGRARVDFAITLSIHNVSPDRAVILDSVVYYDTAGRAVETYLPRPVALKPFGTIQFFVPRDDVRGGTGANFVVRWSAADARVDTPHVETVMIGVANNQSLAFVVPARPIEP